MKSQRLLLFSAVIAASTVQIARADAWDQRTVFTFSGPVEVPGQVLDPGTYVFKLVDSSSDRNIVQVFNKNENQLLGTFITIPDYRVRPSGKPIITFEERASGSPEAVRSWFYPGDNYGHDFVYPKPKAVALAKANNTPVASMPPELTPNMTAPVKSIQEPPVVALKAAPVKAQTPAAEEVEVTQVFAVEVASAEPARALPTTASNLPLIGISGLFMLAAAFVIRMVAARVRH